MKQCQESEKQNRFLITVWISAHSTPIIRLCLGWTGVAISNQMPNARNRDVSENSLHISRLKVSLHLAQPSVWKTSRARQHQVQTRICAELQNERHVECERLRVSFHNHSATKPSVNQVQTATHGIHTLCGLIPAYPYITIRGHSSALSLVPEDTPVDPSMPVPQWGTPF